MKKKGKKSKSEEIVTVSRWLWDTMRKELEEFRKLKGPRKYIVPNEK